MIGTFFGKLPARNRMILLITLLATLIFLFMVLPPTVSILIGLFVFGLGYDVVIEVGVRRKLTEGYTAILVVVGTLVTIGGIHFLSLYWDTSAALLALAAFAASGLPMVAGDVGRYLKLREQERKEMRNL